ncbi:MAG: ATP-binding protein [Candidatus Hodarchaeales archaeon]
MVKKQINLTPKPKDIKMEKNSEQSQTPITEPTDSTTPTIYKPHIKEYKLKMMIYGPPGVGKTSLLATAELHKLTAPILLINVEGGMLSVADSNILGLKEPPDVVDLNNFEELESIFWYLAKGDHPYKSVGIDSLSELQMINLEGIIKKLVGKVSGSGAKRESLDDIWREDYGTSTQQLRRVVRRFRDLPMHVFFSCHDATSQDKDRNEIIHPMLTPKLRSAIMGYMDAIGYMYVDSEAAEETKENEDQTPRRLLCRPFGKWVAKDRSPGQRLGLVIENPTVPIIINRILGK